MIRVGDLIPQASGSSHLGVDGSGPSTSPAFDANTIIPFGQIHQISGVYHDPLLGQSGILRFSLEAGAFQVSVNGGRTFNNLSAGAGVDSVGVINGANLTGNVDLATASSGFLSITDNSGSSPISFAVDHLALSGLWDFPSQGFGGSIVNSLTDANGTESQGTINIVGVSGISVDLVGQTLTIGSAAEQLRCYSEDFVSANVWTATHNLGTEEVVITVRDTNGYLFIPDKVLVQDANSVQISNNIPIAGTVVIVACIS